MRKALVSCKTQEWRAKVISLMKTCSKHTHLVQIHAHIISSSLLSHSSVSLHFLSALRDLTYSCNFFHQIDTPSRAHYNAMIRAYSASDCSAIEGLFVYRDLKRNGLSPNAFSSSFALKCCRVGVSSLAFGVQIHAAVFRDGFRSDTHLLTSLMQMYSCFERFGDACHVFDEMAQRDTVAWNVLVSCYLRCARNRDALTVFDAMQSGEYRCEPDHITCLFMLQACSELNALDFGERVHRYVEERGYGGGANVKNSLVSMYSRCGCLEKAYGVFREIEDKDVVSWSAMISGLAMNGKGLEAIDVFRQMEKTGVFPNEQTFTGLLSACSHCGLVDEGRLFFNRMCADFGISPNVHHYGCMVDLLGRAGLIDQAYQLVVCMDVEPDPEIWRTLLGACRIHGRVDMADQVFARLVEIKAQEASDYVLLLNIYSSAGQWDNVREVRMLLKEKAIFTTQGRSTVELKGAVHEFCADDFMHPQKDEIYGMLAEINGRLKFAGYEADESSELHCIGTREKERALSYHSEKLAIAFGILSTPQRATIRVAKNLRTCVDCHNFAKVLSRVYNREVVVRDRNRFHHFRLGQCSCNDYW